MDDLNMRLEVVYVPERLVLTGLLSRRLDDAAGGVDIYDVPGLPDDAVVLRVYHSLERRAFGFVIRSAAFAPVPDGQAIPTRAVAARFETRRCRVVWDEDGPDAIVRGEEGPLGMSGQGATDALVADLLAAVAGSLTIPTGPGGTDLNRVFSRVVKRWLADALSPSLAGGLERFMAIPGPARGMLVQLLADRLDQMTVEVLADWLEENGRDAEGRAVRRLKVAPDDVLVVSSERALTTAAQQEAARGAMKGVIDRTGCKCVVLLPPGWSLEAIPEERMLESGWVRADPVSPVSPLSRWMPCGHQLRVWRPREGTAAGALAFRRDPVAHGLCEVCHAVLVERLACAGLCDLAHRSERPDELADRIRARTGATQT